MDKETRRAQNIHHVNRIIGQLNALVRLMDNDMPCHEVATLALTVRNSVNSLSIRILEGFIANNMLVTTGESDQDEKLARLQKVLSLYR